MVEQRAGAALLRHKGLQVTGEGPRQQSEERNEIALAGSVRSDENRDLSRLKVGQIAYGLEPPQSQAGKVCHGLPPF
jgi:hypothetical protein